jgi:hypothetical protein
MFPHLQVHPLPPPHIHLHHTVPPPPVRLRVAVGDDDDWLSLCFNSSSTLFRDCWYRGNDNTVFVAFDASWERTWSRRR